MLEGEIWRSSNRDRECWMLSRFWGTLESKSCSNICFPHVTYLHVNGLIPMSKKIRMWPWISYSCTFNPPSLIIFKSITSKQMKENSWTEAIFLLHWRQVRTDRKWLNNVKSLQNPGGIILALSFGRLRIYILGKQQDLCILKKKTATFIKFSSC